MANTLEKTIDNKAKYLVLRKGCCQDPRLYIS